MHLQQGQGQTQQQQQVPTTPEMNDRDIMTEMLTLEKHAATLFHTATVEASNQQLYQCCSSIMQETLACQRNLYNLMSQKGWYKMQNADQQQIGQAYQQFSQSMQTQFPNSN